MSVPNTPQAGVLFNVGPSTHGPTFHTQSSSSKFPSFSTLSESQILQAPPQQLPQFMDGGDILRQQLLRPVTNDWIQLKKIMKFENA